MNNLKINKNGSVITLYGNKSVIESEKNILEGLDLTGIESKDRLIIQQCMDTKKFKSDILYNGNSVYSLNKIVKEYRKLQKTGTLENLSKTLYNFFTLACGDIAHYNIDCYKDYYNYDLKKLEENLLRYSTSGRFTDRDNIFKKLKIGSYYKERENIDIDVVPLKTLQKIIKDYGFDIKVNNNIWNFYSFLKDFSFAIKVNGNKSSDIIKAIQKYYQEFDKDKYIEKLYGETKDSDTALPISKIVYNADFFVNLLSDLNNELLYKCRNEAELLSDYIKQESREYDLELEPEM